MSRYVVPVLDSTLTHHSKLHLNTPASSNPKQVLLVQAAVSPSPSTCKAAQYSYVQRPRHNIVTNPSFNKGRILNEEASTYKIFNENLYTCYRFERIKKVRR